MSHPPAETTSSGFNHKNSTHWTLEGVREYVNTNKKTGNALFFQNFYGWSSAEYAAASSITAATVDAYFPGTRTGVRKPGERSPRDDICQTLVNGHPNLFRDRHEAGVPAWYDATLLLNAQGPSGEGTVTDAFLVIGRNDGKRAVKKEEKDDQHDGERQSRARKKMRPATPAPTPSRTSSRARSINSEGGRSTAVSETGMSAPFGVLDLNEQPSDALIIEHATVVFVSVTVVTDPSLGSQQLTLYRSPVSFSELPLANERADLVRIRNEVFREPMPDHHLMYFREGQPFTIDRPLAFNAAIVKMLSGPRPYLSPREVQVFMVSDEDHMDLIPEDQRQNDVSRRQKLTIRIGPTGTNNTVTGQLPPGARAASVAPSGSQQTSPAQGSPNPADPRASRPGQPESPVGSRTAQHTEAPGVTPQTTPDHDSQAQPGQGNQVTPIAGAGDTIPRPDTDVLPANPSPAAASGAVPSGQTSAPPTVSTAATAPVAPSTQADTDVRPPIPSPAAASGAVPSGQTPTAPTVSTAATGHLPASTQAVQPQTASGSTATTQASGTSPATIASAVQGATVSAAPRRWRRMTRYAQTEHVHPELPLPTVPSVQFTNEVVGEQVPWMCNQAEVAQALSADVNTDEALADAAATGAAGDDMADNVVSQIVRAKHMNRATWLAMCKFLDFDPAEHHPRSTIYWKGWKSAKPLFVTQAYTAVHLAASLSYGLDFVIMGHDMGLGKTCMAMAVVHLLSTCGQANMAPDSNPVLNTGALASAHGMRDENPIKPRRGPSLFVVPSVMLAKWAEEFSKFLRRSTIQLVMVNPGSTVKDMTKLRAKGWLDYEDEVPRHMIPVRDEELSPKLIDMYASEKLPTVADVLEADAAGRGYAWQRRWWVLGSSGTLPNRVGTTEIAETKRYKTIHASWAYVVVDEFHESVKHATVQWRFLYGLPGFPKLIYISGTPLHALKDIVPCFMVEQLGWFDDERIGWETSLSDLAKIEDVRFTHDCPPGIRDRLTAFNVCHLARMALDVDRTLERVSRWGSQELDDEGHLAIIRETTTAAAEFGEKLAPHLISWRAHEAWKVEPDWPGVPVIAMPPHVAFDLQIGIDEEYHEALRTRWDTDRLSCTEKSNGQAGRTAFAGMVPRFKMFSLFPCIVDALSHDPELLRELGGCTVDEIKRLVDPGNPDSNRHQETRLWHYMPVIHRGLAMTAMRDIVRDTLAQTDAWGNPKKIVIGAHTPSISVVVIMYLWWLADQDHDNDVIGAVREATLVDSWRGRRPAEQTIKNYKSQDADGAYDGRGPRILVAMASQIKVGLDLVPADTMIMLDSNWKPADDMQPPGRIQRSREVQWAEMTTCYRFVCAAECCRLGWFLTERQKNKQRVLDSVMQGIPTAHVDLTGDD